MRSFVLAFAAVAAVVSVGCSSHETVPPTGAGDCAPGQYCAQNTPPPTMTTTPPTTTAPPPTTGGGTGTGACSPIAAGAFATPLMVPLQQSEAPGMQPEGGAVAGQCSEGQSFEVPLTLQPGKCYTVIAVSMGVQELDAMIAAQPLPQIPPTPLAQDQSTGGQAVVAGKGSCFRNAAPIAVPAKVIVKATRGTGAAVAQVYVK